MCWLQKILAELTEIHISGKNTFEMLITLQTLTINIHKEWMYFVVSRPKKTFQEIGKLYMYLSSG